MPDIPDGDWTVEIDDEYPDYVKMSFAEFEEDGIVGKLVFMPADIALQFAEAIIRNAKYLKGENI
jgi:hypothetical protein